MVFEVGKCYRHNGGEDIQVVGQVDTTMYGNCLVAETNKGGNLIPIGKDEAATVNWKEISKEEWMKNFS